MTDTTNFYDDVMAGIRQGLEEGLMKQASDGVLSDDDKAFIDHFYSVKPGELLTLAELGKLQGSCYQHQILFIINNYCSWYMSSECRFPMCNGQFNFEDRSTSYFRSSVSTVIIATRTRISF